MMDYLLGDAMGKKTEISEAVSGILQGGVSR